MRRRRVLKAGAVGAVAGIAGCISIGGGDGMHAVSLADGSERWTNDVGDVSAGPELVDGTLYVGAEDTMYALSPDDGSELWAAEMEGAGNVFSVRRATFLDDTVLVPANEALAALSLADGSERWRFRTEDEQVWAAPSVADDTVVVGSGETNVHGLSVEDGSEQWRFDGGDLVDSSATAAGSTVYFGTNAGRVYALDVADGSERWRFGTADAVGAPLEVGGGNVYVGTEGRLTYALNADDGSEQWRFDSSGGDLNVSTKAPTAEFLDGSLYVSSNDVLYALRASDGSREWTVDTDGSFFTTVVEDVVYVSASLTHTGAEGQSEDYGYAYAYDRLQGERQWGATLDADGAETAPGVGDGTLCIGREDGGIAAISADDGSDQWVYGDAESANAAPIVTDDTGYFGTD